jgi:PAS domain S-box-containing protein
MNDNLNNQDKIIEQLKAELQELRNNYELLKTTCESEASEYKREIKALLESEKENKELFYNAPVNYHSLNSSGVITIVNPEWLNSLGYKLEEVVGHPFSEFIAPDYSKLFLNEWLPFLRDAGQIHNIEFEMVHKDGSLLFVSLDGKLVKDNKVQSEQTHFIWTDITRRKSAEELHKKKEHSYQELFNNVNDAIYIQDSEGTFLDVNEGAERMYGYTRAELIGKNPLFVSAPGRNDFDSVAEMVNQAFNGEPQCFEFWGKRANGEIFPKEVRIVPGTYNGERVNVAMAQDITERKRAEEILRESEIKFKSLVESTSDMIWETNLQGKYTYVSPQFECLLGYAIDEVLGKSPFDFIFHENISEIRSQSDAVIQDGIPFSSFVNKYRHRDGHYLYFETSGVPVFDAIGKLSGYRGISRDITQRRLDEKELYKLSSVVHQNPNTIIITNLNGTIEYINPAGCTISGYDPDEIIGRKPSVFGSGKTPKETYKLLWSTILEGKKWSGVFENKRKNGELYWESALIIPLRDSEGTISHYLGVKEDITNQILAKEALKESEDRYRQLFEASPDAIILADIETGMLTDANPSACKLLGYSVGELREMHQTMIHPERYKEFVTLSFEKHVQKALNKELPQPIEAMIRRSDGVEVSVEVLANFITLNGRNILQGVFRDITERLQVRNELLKAKEKAETSDKLKSAFLRNISHELRTPLNGIIGFSEMITQMDSSEEDRLQFNKMIKKSSARLINTITGYMDISLIVSGLTQINKRFFSLQHFLDKTSSVVKNVCNSNDFQLKIVCHVPEKDIEIFTDEDILNKVFAQLIDNAVKFTKKGSITLGYEHKPGLHKFYISDTGAGISNEYLDVIFDIFRQVDLSTTRSYEGSGLGLSIAKGFVKLLGGEIGVESEINEGSTFYFTIPDEEHGIIDFDSEDKSSLSMLPVVLIAEDDDSSYKYIEILLKKASFKVLRARNGFETLEICRRHPEINILITDMKMPDMDGLESTRQIRAILPELPIIALSGLISTHDEEAAKKAGCNDYMIKPVSKSKLLDTMNKWLNPTLY